MNLRSFPCAKARSFVLRSLVLFGPIALLAVSCSGVGGPTLTSTRPPTLSQLAVQPRPAPRVPESLTPSTTEPPASEVNVIPVSSTPSTTTSVAAPPPPPVTSTTAAVVSTSTSTTASVSLSRSSLPSIQSKPAPVWQSQRILVARPDWRDVVPVYDAPNGSEISFKDGALWSYTYRGNPLVVRVTQGSEGDEWVEAELPMRPWDNFSRPNGVRGWLRTENFEWRTVNHHIQIDLADENGNPRVDFWDGDTWITGTYAIIGKASTHTPVMDSFVVEKIPGYSPGVGTRILMLSGFSTRYESFGGGLPRIALHGTNIPNRVGEHLSNGCIRVPNGVVELISDQAPLGTRVNIIA